jgi:hypothetical protein
MEICPEGGQGSSRTVAPLGTGTATLHREIVTIGSNRPTWK